MTDKGFRRLQREREFQYNIGMFMGIFYAGMVTLFLFGQGADLRSIGIIITGLSALSLLSQGGRVMRAFYKLYRWFRETDMKFEALTNFLKVKFVHVPEHYECEKAE